MFLISLAFKYLLLEALGVIPEGAKDNLSETNLQNAYRFILGQLLNAEMIRMLSEALLNESKDAFIDFLDRLSQYWVESVQNTVDEADAQDLSHLQFWLSSEATDELCFQLEKGDDLSISAKSKPQTYWPIRAFLLWGQRLKHADCRKLGLRYANLWALTEFQWKAFCKALKYSGITSLDLSFNDLFELKESYWQILGEILNASEINSLDLSHNFLFEFEVSKQHWQTFGEALNKSGITMLDLSDNKLSFSQWCLVLNFLDTVREEPLALVGINFNKLSNEQAQSLYRKFESHYPAFKIYQPVSKRFKDLYESLNNIKKAITSLTNPKIISLTEEIQQLIQSLITELYAKYDSIKNLNKLYYPALFNEYYATAFLVAKTEGNPQSALKALQSVNLSPVVDYPGKAQLSTELTHAALNYALMLDTHNHEVAETMYQAVRKLLKQLGQREDYYFVHFTQQSLDLE